MDGDVGVWSSQAPTCQQIKCNPVQVNPMYGAVSCTNSNLAGSKCIFACEFEYDLIGDIEIMCDGSSGVVDGVWSNEAPRCQRKQCNEAQPAPMNGMRTCSGGNSLGSICEYTCHTDFVRNGPQYSTCTDYGSGIRLFDNQAPICEPKQCPDAAAGPANGFRICSNGNKIGSTCEYGCNVGFKVIGPQIAACTKNADGSL
uniref:Sushi domain-containing protein n=1 Tax=Ciona savignyi TaxID=51511 RepID=H2YY98_CIOSA